MSRAQSKRSIRVPECWTLRILDASCPCFSSTFSIIRIMMLPFTAGWECSQVPSLAQCNRKPWRSESRPHCLYSISDITKLSSTSLGKLKTSLFVIFKPCILYYIYVSSVYQNRYALKGICIFQLQFKFLLTRESYKGYIYSLVQQQQHTLPRFPFLYTGNMPSFIIWNWMPLDFSKCTSNICLSGKLGPNKGKISRENAFLQLDSAWHSTALITALKLKGRVTDGEW